MILRKILSTRPTQADNRDIERSPDRPGFAAWTRIRGSERSNANRFTFADASLRFWRRSLWGRHLISILLFVVIACSPVLGPNRAWLALALTLASTIENVVLGRLVQRRGEIPRVALIMDHALVGLAAVAAPAVLPWGLAILALTVPYSVVAYHSEFAYRLVATWSPVFLAIALWRQPQFWYFGLTVYVIGGAGSCAIISVATDEERRVRARYIDILDQLQAVVFESRGPDLPLTYVNPHIVAMLGFSIDRWLDPAWWQSRVHREDLAAFVASREQPDTPDQREISYRMIAEDGRTVRVLEVTRSVPDEHGRTTKRGILVDVTERSRTEAQARQLGMFVDQIPLALQIIRIPDPDDLTNVSMVAANQVVVDEANTTLDDVLAMWPQKYCAVDSQPGMMEAFAEVRRTGIPMTNERQPWTSRAGVDGWVNVEAFSLGNGFVGVSYQDITDQTNAAEALQHQANHDALTGLPNRSLLRKRLSGAMTKPNSDTLALLVMDLDQFKEVNDALGHHHGDRLLVELSGRLGEFADDNHSIARLGGDEFAMLITDCSTRHALEVGREIGRMFAQPIVIDGITLQTNVSVGISMYPEHAEDPEALLQHADAAMYRAKQGGTGVALFSPDQSKSGARRFQLLSDLRAAIEAGELTVHYQPRVDLHTGAIEGTEALVRWEHPVFGMLPPDEFIALAEVSGLIQPLTQFVIRVAVADAAFLSSKGHHLPVAVNLSVRNLYSPDLVDNIMSSLDKHGLPVSQLRVELTESEIMDDPALAMQVLQRLRSHGVEVSIDDFGTGYSSLSYLRDLPIDEIKIDRSFVADITDGDDVVVRSIIDLGHALGVKVVGEGVETAIQWDHLRRLGCDVAQGYLFSRPLPFDALLRYLDDRPVFGTAPGVFADPNFATPGVDTDADATLGASVTRG